MTANEAQSFLLNRIDEYFIYDNTNKLLHKYKFIEFTEDFYIRGERSVTV